MAKRRIVFIVTQDCQLRCHYCYLVGKNQRGKMTWETARKIVDFLMSLPVVEDTVVIDFIGGEPLLEIDLIEKISDYLVDSMKVMNHPWLKSFSFRFTTNGLAYSSEKVQQYVEKYKDHLSVQLSIDGTKRKHDLNRVFINGEGSYDKILPSVKLWINQFGRKAMSFMVLSHEDLPFLSESAIHLIKLGIKDIAISLVVEDVWKSGDEMIFESELMIIANYLIDNKLWNEVTVSSLRQDIGTRETDEHIYPCGNPMYVFDSKGNIYTCVRFVDFSLRSKPARIVGTIQTGIDYNKLRPLLSFDRESCYPGQCLKCEVASGCRWCPAENYDASESGTVFQRTTTVCSLHKANVRVNNYYWSKINFIEENERS
ncbi:MAG: radical SAM peptide maturase, CXXX-repeat target family [Aeriscardovia sp.]|nr:radical SAM peptide maturase, CXXX-repeat target family [Aeriscardovia sp.]MBP3788544.1 radical SAM peptide maturase, CXXX-repeat target family [Prevotella sp.]